MCQATLSFGAVTITRTVVLDGGFTEELSLEPSDVIALGLGAPVERISMKLADHSQSCYDLYAPVTVTLTFSDGSTESARLTPQVFVAPPMTVPAVNSEERLFWQQWNALSWAQAGLQDSSCDPPCQTHLNALRLIM